MWGHDAGSLQKGYGIGSKAGDMLPGEAIAYMGIPNVCMVRFTGTPLPPFDDYVKQFANAKRLTWSFVDGDRNYTTEQKRLQALDLAAKLPNFTGIDMDDFFVEDVAPKTDGGEAQAHLSVEEVRQAHGDLMVGGRKLDLSVVVYSNQLHPAIKRHLDLVDSVYFWTWHASELKNLEANFAAYKKIEPAKRTLMGIIYVGLRREETHLIGTHGASMPPGVAMAPPRRDRRHDLSLHTALRHEAGSRRVVEGLDRPPCQRRCWAMSSEHSSSGPEIDISNSSMNIALPCYHAALSFVPPRLPPLASAGCATPTSNRSDHIDAHVHVWTCRT